MANADIGLIGLAVMGENLVLNMANNRFHVAVYNRTTAKVEEFINGRAKGKTITGCTSLEEFCKSLKKPRKVMMMVRAGSAVDDLIDHLLPYLEPGDILIDGGNSHYPDSNRRAEFLEGRKFRFIGTGVSGGEEGALTGPSLMPGGSEGAWEYIKPIFQTIAAKVDGGTPCCDWVGQGGSGHFVKMVHNGIEYGDMQLIAEAYHVMKSVLGMTNDELAQVFAAWNKGELDSYLIEITSDIFRKLDDQTKTHVVDLILDSAGQKGTGKWTASVALDLGRPVTLIGEAVFARFLSALKDERVKAAKILKGPKIQFSGDKKQAVEDIRQALYAAKLVSYAQGFTLMRAAAEDFSWNLNYGAIALMWRGGCIIRSRFLGRIKEAFDRDKKLVNLLLDPWFTETLHECQPGWRRAVVLAAQNGIPLPTISSALCYFDGYRTERLPANLVQAQRDYFGAHTYERIDKPRGQTFHTNWTGRGGTTSSTSYNA